MVFWFAKREGCFLSSHYSNCKGQSEPQNNVTHIVDSPGLHRLWQFCFCRWQKESLFLHMWQTQLFTFATTERLVFTSMLLQCQAIPFLQVSLPVSCVEVHSVILRWRTINALCCFPTKDTGSYFSHWATPL